MLLSVLHYGIVSDVSDDQEEADVMTAILLMCLT